MDTPMQGAKAYMASVEKSMPHCHNGYLASYNPGFA